MRLQLGVNLAILKREDEAAVVWSTGMEMGKQTGRDPESTATLARNLKRFLTKKGRMEEAAALGALAEAL